MNITMRLRQREQQCTRCQKTPAPFVPVAVLLDQEAFDLPFSLCEKCLHAITREELITPEIRAEAVAKLYDHYGLSPIINPHSWVLRYREVDTFSIEKPNQDGEQE